MDLGAHSGYFVQALNLSGWDAVGVEINAKCVEFARQRGIHVINNTLESAPLKKGVFNLVTMSHVLEHVFDLNRAIKKAWNLLTPGGHFFGVVPNYGSPLLRALYGSRLECFRPGQHIWYFTKESLSKICIRRGFQLIDLKTENYITPESQFPMGATAKRMVISWIRYRDEGSEILALFRKPQ